MLWTKGRLHKGGWCEMHHGENWGGMLWTVREVTFAKTTENCRVNKHKTRHIFNAEHVIRKHSINSKSCTTFTTDVQNVRPSAVCSDTSSRRSEFTGRRSGLWRSCSWALRRCIGADFSFWVPGHNSRSFHVHFSRQAYCSITDSANLYHILLKRNLGRTFCNKSTTDNELIFV